MPVTTDNLRPMTKLNVLFAVSSVLLLITTVWFVWVDYDRPWRDFQTQYMTNQAALAHFEYLRTQTAEEAAHREAARENLENATKSVQSRADEIGRLKSELAEQSDKHLAVKLDYGNANVTLVVTRDAYEKALGLHGPDAPETKAARNKVDYEAEHVDDLRIEIETIEDKQRDLRKRTAELTKPLTDAEKEYRNLMKVVEDAEKKEKQYGSRLLRTVFNFPMLDFAAPQGTPAHQEIKQLVLPDVRQRLNYLEGYTTDRCVTCHVAIDNRNFTRQALVGVMEETLPAINEELVRQGRSPLPLPPPPAVTDVPPGAEVPKIKPGRAARHWNAVSRKERMKYFDSLLERVNQYLEMTGKNPIVFEEPLLGHPNLDLFVNADSKHPMSKMGCTVCHEGNPEETDFVLASHTPTSHHQEAEWKEKYYVKNLGVPIITFETTGHYWDRPMIPSKYIEGSCMKCHEDVADIGYFENEPQAETIKRGRDLFARAGCINCHNVDTLEGIGRVGPDLTHVADKLDRGFMEQWIFNPREFRPSTWMPHFFNQENNDPGSANEFDPNPILRTETEVQAITHYLLEMSVPWQAEKPPEGMAGDAQRGQTLFKEVGCLGCHANLAEFGESWITKDMEHRLGKTQAQARADFEAMDYGNRVQYAWDNFISDRETIFTPEVARFNPAAKYNRPVFTRIGPELSAMGSKASADWTYAWVRNPRSYSSYTRMPSLRLTEQEALDIAVYLEGLEHDKPKTTPFPNDPAHRQMAGKLLFDLLATQRSERRTEALLNDEHNELTQTLIESVSKSPYADHAIRRIQSQDTESKRMLLLGSKMILHYGCYACHSIVGFESATLPGTDLTYWAEKPLAQLDFAFFDHAFDEMRFKPENVEFYAKLYPPNRTDLIKLAHGDNPDQEISHAHSSFAYHKLRNPRIWDRGKLKQPYDKLKMPNFYFAEDEAEALVTFLMSRKPPRVNQKLMAAAHDELVPAIAAGRDLTRELNCVGCHQVEDNVATIHQYYRTRVGGTEYFDEVNAPPYLRGEGAKIQPSWLFGFLHNVEPLRPWLKVRMPSFALTTEQGTALVEYFVALAQDEAQKLEERLKPVHEYIDGLKAKATGAPVGSAPPDAALPSPTDAWFNNNLLAKTARYLGEYAIANRLIGPYALNPDENDYDSLVAGYDKVLEKVDFVRNLFDVPYPFVDAPRPLVSEERFHNGEGLLLELGCLKCHILGDPRAEGANPSPSAPNLNLVFRRLRQDWVRQWLRAPADIQPGTKMPQLFPGGQSAFSDPVYDDTRAELQAKYGEAGNAQIELLLDFLYNAGLKNHTTIQPGGIQPPAPPAGDEEFEEQGEELFEE